MSKPSTDRRRGAVDTVDLMLGLLLGLGLPLIAFGVVQAVFPDNASPEAVISKPAPDAEEVSVRLDHVKKLYDPNALFYLNRARRAEGNDQFRWMGWAARSLQQVKVEASALKSLIELTDSTSEYASALAMLQEQIDLANEGLKVIKDLDHLGTLRIDDL